MLVILFSAEKKINDLCKVVFKEGLSVEGQLREVTSIIEPHLTFTDEYFPQKIVPYNMLYIPIWSRYYFITDIEFAGNLVLFSCREDVLFSWYDSIINQTFYCLRSASAYDSTITDTRFPAKAEQKVEIITLEGNNPWSDYSDGVYVLAISSGGDDYHIGSNIYYLINSSDMSDFMGELLETALENLGEGQFGEALIKFMCDPISYIRSCFYFPFTPNVSTKDVDRVRFGWWAAEMNAKIYEINRNSDTYAETTMPLTFDETIYGSKELNYKMLPPYSKLILTAYPFGMIELPLQVVQRYVAGDELELVIKVDLLTGMCSLAVEEVGHNVVYYYTTCQLGVEIPVAQVVQQFIGTLASAATTVGEIASGNVAGAALGTLSAIENFAPQVTAEGAIGGLGQLQLSQPWRLTRYFFEVDDYPDTEGAPCAKNCVLSDLSGYAIFDHAFVDGDMLSSEKEQIQSLLESGVFIG